MAQHKGPMFPVDVWNIIDYTLRVKTKGAFFLEPHNTYTLPHAHVAVVGESPTTADRIEKAFNLLPDIQNNLLKAGMHDVDLAMRKGPARVEVIRPDREPILLSGIWEHLFGKVALNEFTFVPAFYYIGQRPVLCKFSFAQERNAHIGIFGGTGSGKTALLRAILITLAALNDPGHLSVVMCDPTGQNLTPFAKLPQAIGQTAISDDECEAAVQSVFDEMQARTRQPKSKWRNKRIVLVVDEFADLIGRNEHVQDLVVQLGQKARQFGIHLILCSQKMTVSVPTTIQGNLNCRFTGCMPDLQDAIRTAGRETACHRMVSGTGSFELSNGQQRNLGIQGLFVDQDGDELQVMLNDISQRWEGLAAHFAREPVVA